MLLPFVTSGVAHWLLMAATTLLALLERTRAPMAAQWGAAWPRLPDRLDVRGTTSQDLPRANRAPVTLTR
jgi:hypothetical protein